MDQSRSSVNSLFSRRFLGSLVIAAAFVAALFLTARPLMAQRPNPGRGVADEVVRRFGTRHMLGMVDSAGATHAETTVFVANNSYKPTRVLMVELAESPAAGRECATGLDPSRITAVHCVESLAPFATTELDVTGARTTGILLYSLSTISVTNACATFEPVKSGAKTMAAWETETWMQGSGEVVGVTAHSVAGSSVTAFTARTALDAVNAGGGQGQPGRANQASQALPVMWAGGSGARLRVQNGLANCQTMRTRLGELSASAVDCATPQSREVQLPGYGVMDVANSGGAGAVTLSGVAQTMGLVDRMDESGWLSYSGPTVAATSNDIAFPLATTPFQNATSELWITNQHVTATAQIDILMWDGNNKLIKSYTDPVPLCPGATRKYDPLALAGPLDNTRLGRGAGVGAELPPMLALRVQSTNRELTDAPPIAGVMLLKDATGTTAYAGLPANPDITALLGARRGQFQMTTVIPNVKINWGTPAESTLLVVQILSQPAPNFASLSLYDETGKIVAEDVTIGLGQGLVGAAVVPLGILAGRPAGDGRAGAVLPTTFKGTAVIKGQDGIGQMGVLAINHVASLLSPTRPPRQATPFAQSTSLGRYFASMRQLDLGLASASTARDASRMAPAWARSARQVPAAPVQRGGDQLAAVTGAMLVRWLDPNAPTPTARPTVARMTPSVEPTAPRLPTSGATQAPTTEPTQVPGEPTVEPTPTSGSVRWNLFVPWLMNGE